MYPYDPATACGLQVSLENCLCNNGTELYRFMQGYRKGRMDTVSQFLGFLWEIIRE